MERKLIALPQELQEFLDEHSDCGRFGYQTYGGKEGDVRLGCGNHSAGTNLKLSPVPLPKDYTFQIIREYELKEMY